MLDCKIKVGDCLSLDTLGRIDYEQRSLAGCDGARHLVREVHVARSVDKVKSVLLSIVVVIHLDSVALDGDTLLLLQIHRIEDLILHITGCQRVCNLEHSVCESTLAVVDMGYNTKVSCFLHRIRIIGAKIAIYGIFSVFLFKPYLPENI